MSWISRMLRGNRVWARVGAGGRLEPGPDGRVDVLYKPGGKVYRASPRNLEDDPRPETLSDGEADPAPADEAAVPSAPLQKGANGSAAPRAAKSAAAPARAAKASPPPPRPMLGEPFIIYADGACTGNPGPAGLGVVLLDGARRQELSEYLGAGTNNIAEDFMAIVRALEHAPRERTVLLHSDSAYALGLLGKGWKPKANQELVARMKKLGAEFRDLRLIKVAGHAGIVENERADALARDAVVRRK